MSNIIGAPNCCIRYSSMAVHIVCSYCGISGKQFHVALPHSGGRQQTDICNTLNLGCSQSHLLFHLSLLTYHWLEIRGCNVHPLFEIC